MRYSIVARILGHLVLFLGGAMLLPIPFSLYYGEGDYKALLISAGIAIFIGLISLINRSKEELRSKEGFAVVALGWVIFSVFGALPFVISGAIPSYADAFFETMSGFTTTGASILNDIESLPKGILFWRSLTHWLGGMGIIVLTIAILPFLGVGGMQLFKAESPGPVVDKLKPRITETAKILWGVYVLFSAAETVLLMFGGMSLFEALCHTFGTMATGGFSTRNTSVGAYGSAYIDIVIIVFMFIAGSSFSLHYRWLNGDFKSIWKSPEFKFYLWLIVVATGLLTAANYLASYGNFFASMLDSAFQTVAIMTTTGFATADFETWTASSQVILLLLMFVGGCAGSTGGGIKVIRIYLLLKFVFNEFVRLLHPQAVIHVKIGNTAVDRKVVANVSGFFILFMLTTAVGIIIMSFLGLDLVTSISAVAATINNIGPGLGEVGPLDNYSDIPIAGKWILSFFMLIGRLELFTVIILLAPSFWRK